jgi:hypothetical protein
MPVAEYPQEPDKINLEEEPFAFSQKDISDIYALSEVTRTFEMFESYRRTHDARWNLNDKLYYAFVESKNWPGSSVPRASIGSHLIFEQIMAIYPSIAQGLFADPDFYSLEAGFGGDPKAIRAQKAHLDYALEFSAAAKGTTVQEQFMQAALCMLLYGNGAVIVEYNTDLKAPEINWVDTRDLYVDPFTPSPSLQQSRAVIVRRMMSIKDIVDLRGDKRMNVPSDEVLYGLASQFRFRNADSTKQQQEALRGNNYSASVATQIPLPDHKQLEVLAYYTKSRIVWVLNGKHVLFNEPNPYGEIPIYAAGAYPVPGRFYWMSVADVQESNQRYLEGLFNNRLDYMSLMLFPPRFVTRLGYQPSQQTWGPGSVFAYDNPDKQYIHTTTDITQNIYQELAYIRQDADRATGISGLVSGIPSPSNANRTLGGMQQQQQGSSLRIYPLLSNLETYMVAPAIRMALKQVRIHRSYSELLPGRVKDPKNPSETQFVYVSPDAFEHPSNVVVRGALKMLNRERKYQNFQILSQTLFTPQFAQVLDAQGKTFDFDEIMDCVYDITGLAKQYRFVREKTQEEIQREQQLQQQQQQTQADPKLQQAQIEAQTRKEIMQMKSQTELQKAQMSQKNPEIENQKSIQELQIKQQEAEIDRQMKVFEFQMKERLAQMEMQFKEMEMRLKNAEMQQKLQHERLKSAAEVETNQRKAAIDERSMMQKSQFEGQKLAAEAWKMSQEQRKEQLESLFPDDRMTLKSTSRQEEIQKRG